jgi:hypothetical protein
MNKDTAAVARMVQKWRKPTNPISQGKLGSVVEQKHHFEAEEESQTPTLVMEVSGMSGINSSLLAFSIGTPHADTGFREIQELITSGEIMLKFLHNKKMESVCQTIMKRIIFSCGVLDELRSDNAPELGQGMVRQVSASILGYSAADSDRRPQPMRQCYL